MNCWESVLYAAYKTDKIDAKWIKTFYDNASASSDANSEIWKQLGAYDAKPYDKNSPPNSGDLVFFTAKGSSYPGHVALSLGKDQVLSLWSGPNDTSSVQQTTINDIKTFMEDLGMEDPTVTIGVPPW